jgi:hypothetical protein
VHLRPSWPRYSAPPVCSWWLGLERAAFQRQVEREVTRMRGSLEYMRVDAFRIVGMDLKRKGIGR